MTRVISLVLALVFARAALAQRLVATTFPPMVKMRGLAGEWLGACSGSPMLSGRTARIRYESASGGQAVVEHLKIGDADEMVSVYHQEGDQLMMTHYCSSNTQPRLRTREWPRDLSEFKLEFLDSTNILKANWMNITYLKLEFPDATHLRQIWKSHDPKESATVVEVRRVR